MSTPQDAQNKLIVNSIPVERRLLESRALRRCELSECQAHCCSCGVYLSVGDAQKIIDHQQLVFPHLPVDRHNVETWFDRTLEPDHDHPDGGMLVGTNVVADGTHPAGQTCVFLRPDRKCALQVASVAAGEHPWHLKPFYCALFPLVFHQRELILDDENEVYMEGGTCTRASGGKPIPLFRLFEAEMKLALGESGYQELEAKAASNDEASGAQPSESGSEYTAT